MKKAHTLWGPLAFTLAATFATTTAAAEDEPTVTFKTTEVGPGIHMLSGEGGFTGGNIGLLVGEDGVVLIDDSMPPFLDILQQAIASITDQPVDFLINTHVHGDHISTQRSLCRCWHPHRGPRQPA